VTSRETGELAGLTAIVTGAASGIGLATAQALSANGARVALLDRVTSPEPGTLSFVADVSDDRAVRRAVADAINELGALDVLVNNVGTGAQGTVEDNDDAEWHRVFDVNVVSSLRSPQRARSVTPSVARASSRLQKSSVAGSPT
jgi:NAD(P)-dependent dehydrogenase (short-subunit alcohol dehydrogenase family)